jgi:hypothetical protein
MVNMNKAIVAIAARLKETAGVLCEKKVEWKVPKYGRAEFKFYFGNGEGYWSGVSESIYKASKLKDVSDPKQLADYEKVSK